MLISAKYSSLSKFIFNFCYCIYLNFFYFLSSSLIQQQIQICHSLFSTKASHQKNMEGFLNNLSKFNNSLLNLLFQLFSIKIVSFRKIRYIKIAETHCFQRFYNSIIFASAIPSQSFLVA